MREETLDASADLLAFGIQGLYLFLQGLHNTQLLAELGIETLGTLLGGGAGLALALDKFDGAGDALFESGEIAAAKSEVAGLFVICAFQTARCRDVPRSGIPGMIAT